MKLRAIIICLLIAAVCYPQKSNDGWKRIYIVFDNQGIEVAKRFAEDSSWVIHNPAIALEKMYQEKVKAEEKYKLAVNILKNLDGQGNVKDRSLYFAAVKKYNEYQ